MSLIHTHIHSDSASGDDLLLGEEGEDETWLERGGGSGAGATGKKGGERDGGGSGGSAGGFEWEGGGGDNVEGFDKSVPLEAQRLFTDEDFKRMGNMAEDDDSNEREARFARVRVVVVMWCSNVVY